MEQTNQPVKGYKVFNPDWTCKGFQYEVGKIFEEDVKPDCCNRGFHFCTKASDCFNYYSFNPSNKVAEVLALGEVDSHSDDTKCCTNKIQIVREISWQELLTIVNTGKSCTGLCNTGNRNTGDCNTGDRNTGNWNTGDRNTGDRNTGDCNTGDRNTGDWNIVNASSGCFCTEDQKILIFDKPSDWTLKDWRNSNARRLLNQIPKSVVEWIYEEDMTDKEKEENPTYKTTGGYLKVLDESESAQIWWDGLEDEDKNTVKLIPNFDAEKFEKCTGIKVGD
uniref:Pentapeptide repeat protein n=1 Tax=Siphoviridae sp. ctGfF74 TaxID=2826223 RepID=A0A8S5NJK8_9CAUD|nr:MAG TPA: pentapeptide repeat protein [Siphoviridae sp. ctGfF74]